MDYVHMRQPGDAVCHEPDGEKQGKNPLPRAGIEQEHTAAHHAENTGNQRHKGRKAGIFLQPDITQNIVYARNHRNQAVNRHDSRQQAAWAQESENAQQNQQHSHDQFHPCKSGIFLHLSAPPLP